MDTTTVNFALDKLNAMWLKTAPSIGSFSEQYVRYIIGQEVIQFLMFFIICSISCFLFLKTIRKVDFDIGGQEKEMLLLVFSGVIGAITLLVTIIQAYYTTIALLFPQMYAIQQLLNRGL